MNQKKICIFVDGENLRHSIVDLFPSPIFQKHDYLPKRANWTRFFDWIATEIGGNDAERLRTYWYVVQNLDCTPRFLDTLNLNRVNQAKVFSKNPEFAEKIRSAIDQATKERVMDEITADLKANRTVISGRFEGWTDIQNSIARSEKAVEFRRAGSIRYDLFTKELGSEKAVDVKLATDLLKLKDIYDTAVIVSGDQDYVPAVDAVKDFGKRVVNVSFQKSDGKLLPGGAQRLNHVTDWGLEVKYADLKNFLGL